MGRDRISELPDYLLTQILLNLPTKDSVKTSVLSTRWRNLWLKVPGLDLKPSDFTPHGELFPRFVDRFLGFNHKSRMQKLKIKSERSEKQSNQYRGRFLGWIRKSVDRGIQHLDVETHFSPYMPRNIYKSSTLVSLKLVNVGIENPDRVVSLPCLKTMHLEDVGYDDDPLIMEKLISCCPVLEDLTVIMSVVYCYMRSLRVRSLTLKSFRLTFESILSGTSTDLSVELDAPRLEYLSFKDNQSDRIVIKNLSSLFAIDIDTEFNAKYENASDPKEIVRRNTIFHFLFEVSSVRRMIISQRTIEVVCLYCELIPKFNNLSRLQAAFHSSMLLGLLPVFFESCPNLKDLILDFSVLMEPEQVELSYVPRCLLTTLECVEIRRLTMKDETGVKLVNYFLENASVLKKLSVSFTDSPVTSQEIDIYKNILTSTKRSRICQVFIY